MNDGPDKPARTFGLAYVLLMALLGATLLIDRLNLGTGNTVAGLLIAAVKAAIVAAVFMHLTWRSGVMRLFAGVGLLMLGILLVLSLTDYVTRDVETFDVATQVFVVSPKAPPSAPAPPR